MAGLEGTRLGAYELINRTGSGGMAEVYRARQLTAFNREVAVKVIRPGFSEDPSFRERFLREAQAITRLSHPNILPLIEFGETKGILYLVMPLAREGSLRDLLALRNGPLPPEEAIPLFTQLCNAVEYAHAEGIIHRDIKPQNVLLQSRAHVLLCDFGIARDLAKTNMTTTGTGVGTVEYMAPEQAIGRTDMRSDIYSLGVVLYQLLTGLVPYRGSTPFQVLMRHTNEPLPDPRQINPHLPADVVPILQKALAKDPEQRFQSAQALGSAMQEIGPDATTLLISGSSPQGLRFDRTDRSGQMETLPIVDTSATQQVTMKRPVALLQSPPGGVTGQPPNDSSRGAADTPGETNRADGSRAWNNGEPVIIGSGSGSQPPQWSNQPTYSSGNVLSNRNSRGRRTLIFTLIAILLLVIVVTSASFAYSSFNQGRTSQGARGAVAPGSTTTATFTSTHSTTTTATKTPASANTATATTTPPVTSTPTTQPTVTTTAQPVVFSVTGVNASVDPSNFHGTCAATMLFTFTGTINVPTGSPGGTVSYTWLRSDSAIGPIETVSFNARVTTQTVTTSWQLGSVWGNGTTFWEALQVTAPNSVTSAHANFSFVCQNQNSVTSISASVSPNTYDCSQSVLTFNFSATINISPGSNGVNITYTWARSDGATMSPITLSVPAGQTTVSVTQTWTLGVGAPTGTYWEQVVVTSPNSISSNQAVFSKPC